MSTAKKLINHVFGENWSQIVQEGGTETFAKGQEQPKIEVSQDQTIL